MSKKSSIPNKQKKKEKIETEIYDRGKVPVNWDITYKKAIEEESFPSIPINYPPIYFSPNIYVIPGVTDINRYKIGLPIIKLFPELMSKEEQRIFTPYTICKLQSYLSLIYFICISKTFIQERFLHKDRIQIFNLMNRARMINYIIFPLASFGYGYFRNMIDHLQAQKFKYWDIEQINSYADVLAKFDIKRKDYNNI